jgi:hypothetical protein
MCPVGNPLTPEICKLDQKRRKKRKIRRILGNFDGFRLSITQIKPVSYRKKERLRYTCAVNALLNSGVLLDNLSVFN